jgi:site-specific DNA recombinase
MIAAIYARKSTNENGTADDAKSVARQIESARAFAAAKGWTVDDAHIYSDDAVSGADTKRLVNRQRLLAAIHARPPFGVLIMRDASRLSRRDGDEAFAELKTIARRGVDVWFYQDAQRFAYGTMADNVVGFVKAEMNAQYRRDIARWTYDAMKRKAATGQVTGGRVFGYDNVRVPDGPVTRQINEVEADVVRQIFTLCTQGHGVRAIAKRLNDDGARCPRPQQGRPAGWTPSSVREVLYRPLYHGELVWNRTKKRDVEGDKRQHPRPESEWMRQDVPALRIVAEDLWQQAQATLNETRARYLRSTGGRLWGKPLQGVESRYLLPGLARCGICGGGLYVSTRSHGSRRAAFYGCTSNHLKGARACRNSSVIPMAAADDAILGMVLETLFDDAFVADVIRAVHDDLIPAAARGADRLTHVEMALKTLDAEIAKLTAAIAATGHSEALLTGLQDREQRRGALRHEQMALATTTRGDTVDTSLLDDQIKARLEDWRGTLQRQTPQARQMLRKVLQGPIKGTPQADPGVWELSLTGSLDKVLAGVMPRASSVASPTGFEPVFWP